MAGIKNTEELLARLTEASGESVLESGWGMMGMRNVLVGVTSTALVLEFISVTFKTKELRRIPFEEMELLCPARGDASTPTLMKINVQAAMTDAMTGTLLVKLPGEKLMNITFNMMPRFKANNKAPFRIAEIVQSANPSLIKAPDVGAAREKFDKAGCMKRFLIISAALFVPLMVMMAWVNDWRWEEPFIYITGFFMAAFFGVIFAPLWHWMKRMLTGRG